MSTLLSRLVTDIDMICIKSFYDSQVMVKSKPFGKTDKTQIYYIVSSQKPHLKQQLNRNNYWLFTLTLFCQCFPDTNILKSSRSQYDFRYISCIPSKYEEDTYQFSSL